MARSLARNTRLVISTLGPDSLLPGNCDTTNTFEVKVLDGYSFSQDVTSQEIGVNEAGVSPVRGTLGFNTALNPVDVSFSTYVRAYDRGGNADCVERPLWAQAFGTGLTVGAGNAIESIGVNSIRFGLSDSNHNSLLTTYLYFILENTTYVVEQFSVSGAEVDFSIDGIATINWSGFGSRVNENPAVHARFKDSGDSNYLVAGTDYLTVPATTTSTFLRNKLSTLEIFDNALDTPTTINGNASTTMAANTITIAGGVTLTASMVGGRVKNNTLYAASSAADKWKAFATIVAIDDTGDVITVSENIVTLGWANSDSISVFLPAEHAGVYYNIPITGATLSIENNMTFLTPEELAIVNLPLAGFTGNRVVSGSFTAYLNTGAGGSGGLLADLLKKIEEVSNNFKLVFRMGGSSTATPRVDFTVEHAQVSIPTTSVEDIISTEISFTAKPWDTSNNVGSFEDTNELVVEYFKAL